MDLNTVKDLASVAAPFTTLLATTFLKPKLEKLAEQSEIERELLDYGLVDKFSEYLARAYEKHSYLRTVVFQNNKRRLSDLYIPLTVKQPSETNGITVESYPEQLLPANHKVLLVDTAGMGKSTISRVLFLKAVESNAGIPVFVELRQLKRGLTLLDIIHDEVSAIDEAFSKTLLLKLIRRGDFIFLLDGFDEIALDEREYATKNLHDFISKASGNLFLLTSRQDPALASFPEFVQFVIEPLKKKEAYALLNKYDPTRKIAAELIGKLEDQSRNARLRSFLTNPLLVSLLFKAYDFKPTLPLRADAFYRQVYEALFENHDIAKGESFIREKFTKLNMDDFARVLRVLGMRTVSIGKVEYTADELVSYVREARARCAGLSFSDSDFVKDLIRTVPLFVQDGTSYRWSHKSFQEYFAALYISNDAKGDADRILIKVVESKERQRFANLLELYYDIDQPTFQRVLTKRLLEDFLRYLPSAYSKFAAARVPAAEITLRKLACFGRKYVIFPKRVVAELESASGATSPKLHGSLQEYCIREGMLANGEVFLGSTHFVGDGAVMVIGEPSSVILQVLERRADPLVIDLKSLARRKRKNQGRLPARPTWALMTGERALLLSDDPNDPLNATAKFSRVNDLILYSPMPYGIDERACRHALAEIQRMEAQDAVADFLATI